MSEVTIEARNFRVLEHLKWSPSGVCLLSGPNGAGKSTALDVLRFLRVLFERGHEAAFNAVGGQYFKRIGSPKEEPVTFDVIVGDIRWTTRFPVSARGLEGSYGEELHHGDEIVVRAAMFDEGFYLKGERRRWDDVRCCTKWLWDRGEDEWLKPLVDVLSGIRIYESYWLNQVKGYELVDPRAAFLSGNGRNIWSVLANWKGSPTRYRGQFEWVMSTARRAFPDLISTVEFDRGFPQLYRPGATEPDESLPPDRAADGLLTGLLHLTAVAGARQGSILAFDEMENQLHPHAIRTILHAMREQVDDRDLTIILTTHSPVVMNAFRDEPEQVHVLDRSVPGRSVPVPMTELHSEEWLAQAKLGTLYDQLAFGAPPIGRSPA